MIFVHFLIASIFVDGIGSFPAIPPRRERSDFDQQFSLYTSNSRALSLLLSERVYAFGSNRFDIVEKLDAKARWMAALFPRAAYTTPRGQAMNRFVCFAMPPSLSLRKTDDHRRLYRTTHDPRVVQIIVADEYCEAPFIAEIFGSFGWNGPVLKNYWDSSINSGLVKYLPLGPRFEFPFDTEEIKPSARRRYLYNMIATLETNAGRILLQGQLQRASSNGGISQAGNPLSECFMHNTALWTSSVPTSLTKSGSVPTTVYHETVLDSAFTICPSGIFLPMISTC
jgi:hypothetical protein